MDIEKDIISNSSHSSHSGEVGRGIDESIALFPGSFDPFTRGHADIVERGLKLFDRITIAVGHNEQKRGWIPIEERVRALREFYKDEPRVQVESYDTLTVDFARSIDAHFILRGIRSINDYEYELQIADINHDLSGIETVVLFAQPGLANVSSSIIRELAHYGRDIREWLPEGLTYHI